MRAPTIRAAAVKILAFVFLCILPTSGANLIAGPEIEGRRFAEVLHGEPAGTASSGQLDWEGEGLVRIVIVRPEPAAGKGGDSLLRVMIANEGRREFKMSPKDTWSALSDDGTRLPLEQPEAEEGAGPLARATLPPGESLTFLLALPKGLATPPLAFEYKSHELRTAIWIADRYEPPVAVLKVPPAFPTEGLPADQLNVATASVMVGRDGMPEFVSEAGPASSKPPATPGQAARSALAQWSFKPALVNGVATRAMFRRTFLFQRRSVVRSTFALPPKDMKTQLARLLPESFTYVVPFLSTAGFVMVGKPWAGEGLKGDRAVLLRYGAASGGAGSWVTVGFLSLVRKESGSSCPCTWWITREGEAEEFLKWLGSKLGLEPVGTARFVPQGSDLIPSGYPEEEGKGAWDRAALRRLLAVARTAADAEAEGSNAPAPAEGATVTAALPREGDFLRRTRPVSVEGDVAPPQLVSRKQPRYPEAALRSHLQGRVVLDAVIDEAGEVTDLEILKSIPMLDFPSIDAVCCWKYDPAIKAGRPVPVIFSIFVDYSVGR